MSRAVLVTGGAGYIGSHACKALSKAGYLPVSYDNLSRGFARLVKWGPLEQGDLLDTDRLDAVMQRHKPLAVMHFASLAYVGESVEQPDLYYRNNVEGSRSLLTAMQSAGVSKLVFSSTCATYGIPQTIPIPENHPQQPVNPYGDTKLQVEHMIREWANLENRNWVVFRYFNAAGADPDGDVGEMHDPETHLLPLALQAARPGDFELTIYGTDYPTPDGTCVRDYIHVSDLADAHVLGLSHLLNDGESLALNLGNGAGYSVNEVLDSVRRVTGNDVRNSMGQRRAGDPPELVGNAALARQVLNWNPQFPALDDIVATAWHWMQTSGIQNVR